MIIGLDGVPFGMLKSLAETDVMPNTADLISSSVFKQIHSSIPEVSSVAWSSIITGKNPGEHGIFGFTDLFENTYKLRFPGFSDLRAVPFWEQWPEESVVINVPSTYPVREMNGAHISGFVSVDFNRSVHPRSLVQRLQKMDYRLDVDSQKAHSSMELFLLDVDRTLDARIEAYRYLWDNINWQNFMLVFTGTDRLMHFLWDAYEDEDHKYHNTFLEHFRKIDGVIGEISKQCTDEDLLVMLSDHGFEKLEYNVNVSYVLREQGFLQFKEGQDITLNNVSHGTKAFALDPARIYLNLKGKYPCGTVDPSETEDVLSEIESLFAGLEVNGRKVIKGIYRKAQIYEGPCLANAPDIVLVGAEGFNLKANVKAQQLTDKAVFTGKHTQDTAFLLMRGVLDESVLGDNPTVADLSGIIEKSKACA